MNNEKETHPFEPWVPEGAWILICGTFPPPASRWSMKFYYPNYINDMWRVMGLIYFNDKDIFVDSEHHTFYEDKIKDFLNREGIALSDTGGEVERLRGNASDKYLEIKKPFALAALLEQLPECTDIATTGEKAAGVVAQLTGTKIPKVGEYEEVEIVINDGACRKLRHWRMPSTSRAYPLALAKKAELYGKMLRSRQNEGVS